MEKTTLPPYYTITDVNGVIVSKVTKRISVKEFRDILLDMRNVALEKKIKKLLLDLSSIDFSDLSISERHEIGLAGAEILKGDFRAACVVQKEYINKHGENVASNRGADVIVLDNLDEAYQWLGK